MTDEELSPWNGKRRTAEPTPTTMRQRSADGREKEDRREKKRKNKKKKS